MSSRSRIVILGSSFAAVTAARELRKRDAHLPITLVAPQAELVYSPSLIWVPTGLRQGNDLRYSLVTELQRLKVDFIQARVESVTAMGRVVRTDQGDIDNDGLVVATGARFLQKLPGIEHAMTVCTGITAAQRLRDRLRELKGGHLAFGFAGNPEEPKALRGGPMFELLFGIDTWLRRQGYRSRFELTFFSPAAEPGKRLGRRALGGLMAEMAKRNIRSHLGHPLLGFETDAVRTAGGDLPADLIAFMPGLTGPEWASASCLPLSPGGFLRADGYCRVPGTERVYVAGDAGSFPGPDWLPKQAHMADLQARAAAQNLLLELHGHKPRFLPKPELVCIVDMLDQGMLIYRSEKRSLVLRSRWLHAAKHLFERHYLRGLQPVG